MNDVVKSKSFEQKMKDRVKESIGDLMSDEDLSKIVARGVEDAFFAPRTDNSGYNRVEIPPLSQVMVSDLMSDQVKNHLSDYFKDNKDEINKMIEKVVQEGVGFCVLNAINSKFQTEFYSFQSNIESRMNSGGL